MIQLFHKPNLAILFQIIHFEIHNLTFLSRVVSSLILPVVLVDGLVVFDISPVVKTSVVVVDVSVVEGGPVVDSVVETMLDVVLVVGTELVTVSVLVVGF